ncbi:MAG: PAC2 family protein [Candidatus Heimdallarchaeota archaeon]|nr:PAC2 family protein [Candidatus Heimdallarchaeota archaeon]MDH5645011.1 PAC2 family protein [Candidatus Heimdallarchaeota archaeon]
MNFKIVETIEMDNSSKVIIQAFTGSGLVASIASHQLIYQLNMIEKGYISSPLIPSLGIVRNGLIQRPIRLYENKDYILLLSEVGIPHENLNEFIENLFNWYLSMEPIAIVIIGALPTGRSANAIDLRYKIVASDDETRLQLESKGVNIMPQGAVYGSVALSLLEASKYKLSSYAILPDCVATVPDYLAAKKVLQILSITLNTKIDFSIFETNIEELKLHLIEKENQREENEIYEDYDSYNDFDDSEDDDLSKFI